jgi:hypothetical protein
MVNLPGCIGQGGLQVFRFQIREVREDLLAALASGKELKDVLHTDPHAADAGPAAALIRVVGDAGCSWGKQKAPQPGRFRSG